MDGGGLLSVADYFADVSLDVCPETVPNITVANNTDTRTGSTLRFLPRFSSDGYIHRWSFGFNTRRFALLSVGSMFAVMVGCVERETALAGSRHRWKVWGGSSTIADPVHGTFKDIPSLRSVGDALREVTCQFNSKTSIGQAYLHVCRLALVLR